MILSPLIYHNYPLWYVLSPLKRRGHCALLRLRNLSNKIYLGTHGIRILMDGVEPYESVNIWPLSIYEEKKPSFIWFYLTNMTSKFLILITRLYNLTWRKREWDFRIIGKSVKFILIFLILLFLFSWEIWPRCWKNAGNSWKIWL